MTRATALDRLAARMGVVDAHVGFDRVERRASPDTQRAVLAAMGCAVDDERQAAEALAAAEAEDARRRAPREVVARAGEPIAIPVRGPLNWRLVPERGAAEGQEDRCDDEIALPPLPCGLHTVEVEHRGEIENISLIVAPLRAPCVANVAGAEKLWGFTVALYGLRSDRNLGLGDYADLGAAAAALAAHGAGFLGVNPVHALGAGDRVAISPYSPTHRAFFNTAHIAVDAIKEFDACHEARRILSDNAGELDALRSTELVDYQAIAPIRTALLDQLFETFEETAPGANRGAEFEAYMASRGESLREFAVFEAISESFGPDWTAWPAELRAPEAPGVTAFARRRGERVRFHAWMQWLAENQLCAAQARAKAAGMALGLYLDLAVGARPGGAEVWARRDALTTGVSLGAPPDAFSPEGQNWALAPFSPEGLRRAGYAPFIELLRATMRHAGLVRIDHALGLSRSFWIPQTGEPGGYVRYPLDALLAIVAIEARRAGTVVVGEDLGLVPAEFRDRLAEAGLYGCAIMQFERDASGAFRDPRSYRAQSLASFGTHDTPTLNGFCAARDIDWWMRLGRIPLEDVAAARAARAEARTALARLCEPEDAPLGAACESAPAKDAVSTESMHRALARAGSALVAVQLDDALGAVEQQNLPGTIDEHPNWCRRAAAPVERLADDPRLARLGRMMSNAGRAASRPSTEEETT